MSIFAILALSLVAQGKSADGMPGLPAGFEGVWAFEGKNPLVIVNPSSASMSLIDGRMFEFDWIQPNLSGFFVGEARFSRFLVGGRTSREEIAVDARRALTKTKAEPPWPRTRFETASGFYGGVSFRYGRLDGYGRVLDLKVRSDSGSTNLFNGTATYVGALAAISLAGTYGNKDVEVTVDDRGGAIGGAVNALGRKYGIQGERTGARAWFKMIDPVTNLVLPDPTRNPPEPFLGCLDWRPSEENLKGIRAGNPGPTAAVWLYIRCKEYPGGIGVVLPRKG